MSARVVDALGTWCPVPIHLIDRAARRSAPGDVIELLADDPFIEVDLPAWCHTSGNRLLEMRRDGDGWVARVAVHDPHTGIETVSAASATPAAARSPIQPRTRTAR